MTGGHPKLLLVEDEPSARHALAELLRGEYEVLDVASAEAAEVELPRFSPDIVLTDLRLPGASGLAVVRQARALIPECIVMVMTAHSSIEVAVEAMRSGARDFILKPINFEALELALQRERRAQAVALEVKHLREAMNARVRDAEVWGDSPQMQALLANAAQVADSNATVLITGESGTGKEVLARFLHRHSKRATGPFVPVNCGAIAETLLESEFFGHERGAFTGAVARKLGRFERAQGGTIFLDEIAELSPALQVKLLRVLQERQLERVGGTAPVALDVRVIAATHRDLAELLRQGRFREDLYYRLNVIQLDIPPLRERKTDIPVLWSRFVARIAQREQSPTPETSTESLALLHAFDWPGNVRELENVAERAVVLARGSTIQPAHLPSALRDHAAVVESAGGLRIPGSTLAELEKVAILRTLAAVGGSTTRAAAMLDISPRKIQYRLREWRGAGHSTPPDEAHTSSAPPSMPPNKATSNLPS